MNFFFVKKIDILYIKIFIKIYMKFSSFYIILYLLLIYKIYKTKYNKILHFLNLYFPFCNFYLLYPYLALLFIVNVIIEYK